MVNKTELEIVKKYESQGWRTLRGGAPDFIFLKTDNEKITDFMFVEVKANGDKLTYEQAIYRKILEMLGTDYKVETIQTIPRHAKPTQVRPSRAPPIRPIPNQSVPPQSRPVQSRPFHATPARTIPYRPNPIHATPRRATPNQSKKEVIIDGIES